MKQKDIKLLWGRSGNRCAKCRTQLTQDKEAVTASFTLGEQAHIVGEKEDAARGKSAFTLEQRNSYHNLILLCPTCHTEIDENDEDWPIEKLHLVKSSHELWVTEKLSETVDHVRLAHDTVIASLVDSAVEQCRLESWIAWSSWALGPSPSWEEGHVDSIYAFRQRLVGAIWPPEMDDFRRATVSMAILLHRASERFLENADLIDGTWRTVRFYKLVNPNPNFDADLKRFEAWSNECYEAVYLATKAANWFADVVRERINPMFFRESGKFLVVEGPYSDLSYQTRLLEFTPEEKQRYPNVLFGA
jgi:hypothetical protein